MSAAHGVNVATIQSNLGTLRKTALGAPRVSLGPDVLQMAIGSEGTLGIVTDVVVRLRPKPEVQVSARRVIGWVSKQNIIACHQRQ